MLLLGLLFSSMTALPSAAQQNPQDLQQKSGQQDSAETFKVNVNVVNLYFLTKDKHGTLVPNLGAGSIRGS